MNLRFLRQAAIILFVLLAGSALLAWISNRLGDFSGWLSFFAVLTLASGAFYGVWRLMQNEHPPRWLGIMLVIAMLLRLGVGMVWTVTIPVWGHGTPAERAGYIMGDAYARDQAAWKLANSAKPLLKSFQDNRRVDQYGGFLFISASVYRYLGGKLHQPLLIVVITAFFSALAVLFTWAFTRRAWGEKAAGFAAGFLMLYPEAVLMGSSQMREAFTVTLTMTAFYGLVRFMQDRSTTGLAWILVSLLLYLPFSPPFAALLTGMLAVTALGFSDYWVKNSARQRQLWIVFAGLLLLVLIGLWFTLRQFTPEGMNNPLTMLGWWIRKSASFQAYLSQHASGWMQKIFRSTPEWTHLPMLLAYGVVQPFLPAALVVRSDAPLWPWITFWRAAGWTVLLALLIYAPLLAIRYKSVVQDDRGLARVISLLVWAGILVASFRGGGDMWDNPRYRSAFAGLQAALAAWAWVEHQRLNDPVLRRGILGIAAILAWFLPWYLRRYTPFYWPVEDLFKTLGLGLVSAFLLFLWDWARNKKNQVSDSRRAL